MAANFSAVARAQAESSLTFRRIVELELDPVQGNVDAAHVREIHRRIFQDLPNAGFANVNPGAWRKPVPAGEDWMKERALSTVDGVFAVAYSRMDAKARRRLDAALKLALPAQLRGLGTGQFTNRIASLYAELDYLHPFNDGNSRTLRTFTRQLARAAGFDIDWARFAGSAVDATCSTLRVTSVSMPWHCRCSRIRTQSASLCTAPTGSPVIRICAR